MSKALIANGAGSVIGMVHCLPLPGSFGYGGDMEKILSQAVQDAQTLEKAGVDAVIVEVFEITKRISGWSARAMKAAF